MITYKNSEWCTPWSGMLCRCSAADGSGIVRSLRVAFPSALLAVLIKIVYRNTEVISFIGGESVKSSTLWAALTSTLMFLIVFRTNQAYARFWDGTTLLHQMWGEWFDAASCLIAFSSTSTKTREVRDFRHTLIRLMSLMHASALEEIAESHDTECGYPCIDIGGLDQVTLAYLSQCRLHGDVQFNTVEVLIHMLQTLIVKKQEDGVLKIPPPILSRVFQTLSRGQVNLANCKKITFTLFPFAYAQLISFLFIVMWIGTPVVMASNLEHAHWAFFYTIVPMFGLFALNDIAEELECPFGEDPNDLPLLSFQDHMNSSMLMLIRDEADLVPHASQICLRDWTALAQEGINTERPRHVLERTAWKPKIADVGDRESGPFATKSTIVAASGHESLTPQVFVTTSTSDHATASVRESDASKRGRANSGDDEEAWVSSGAKHISRFNGSQVPETEPLDLPGGICSPKGVKNYQYVINNSERDTAIGSIPDRPVTKSTTAIESHVEQNLLLSDC